MLWKILSLGKLALMSMIFLVPQALRRKFTLMILCLPFMMIIMIVVFCYHLLWRINLIMITIHLLYLIATLLNLLMMLLKAIMREENMVVEIFMLLKHLSMC